MIKLLFSLILLVTGNSLLLAQHKASATIYFDHNQFVLNDSAITALKFHLAPFRPETVWRVRLAGHTDSSGSDLYNQELAHKRNIAVRDFLLQWGLQSEQIEMIVYGRQQPVSANDHDRGKQLNRRVEIWIEQKPLLRNDPFAMFESTEVQTFVVSANTPITIVGKQGTRIYLPKNALIERSGKEVTGNVTIRLQEFYNKSDIVLANLHTQSKGQLLVSGGMIHITAHYRKQQLKLKDGSQMEIDFGAKSHHPDMQVFLGKMREGEINWLPQKPTNTERQRAWDDLGEAQQSDIVMSDNLFARNKRASKLDKYLLRTNDLGWINCDRFLEYESKSNLIVMVDSLQRPAVRLVFKDILSVMTGRYLNDSCVVFSDIPTGMNATLVAFGSMNDEIYYMSKELVVTPDHREKVELVKTTMYEIKRQLRNLD